MSYHSGISDYDNIQAEPSNVTRLTRNFLGLLLGAGLLLGCAITPGHELGGQGAFVALVGGTVIDGTGAPPLEDHTILMRGERIAAVGRNVRIPHGATVFDISGKSVIPGLFDMHGHMYAAASGKQRSQFYAFSLLYLAGGVTTVRSPGDFEPEGMIATRERIKRGEATGPRIFTAGPYFDHAPSQVNWIEGVTSPQEGVEKFNLWKDRIDYVKFYTRITEPEFVAILNAAHEAGIDVTGHLDSIPAARAVELGIDGLEHGIFSISELKPPLKEGEHRYCGFANIDLNSPAANDLIANIIEKKVAITPTFVTYQSLRSGFEPVTEDWLKYFSDEARAYRTRIMNSPSTPNPSRDECLERALDKQRQLVKRVHDGGGIIVAGTDPVIVTLTPGYGLHRELGNLVTAGLTPLEAIKAATLDAATVLHRDSELGSIEPGKLADLVVVAGNPSARIEDVGNTEMIFKGGVRYDPAVLRQAAERQIR